MPGYEVEYAVFRKCVITADSLEETDDRAHTMEGEEIEHTETENTGHIVWNGPAEIRQGQ